VGIVNLWLVLARVEEDPALRALIAAWPWAISGNLHSQRYPGYVIPARELLHPRRPVVCRAQRETKARAAILLIWPRVELVFYLYIVAGSAAGSRKG
jgi:hypothetical protein